MRTILVLILITLSLKLYSQSELVCNELDEKGKKNGIWIQKVDSKLCPVDSGEFSYIIFERYDNGVAVFKVECFDFIPNLKVIFEPDTSYSEEQKILSGKVYYKDKNDVIYYIKEFKNGHPTYFEYRFYPNEGEIWSYKDYYNETWNNTPGTYRFDEFEDSILTMTGWYKNGKRGWARYYEKYYKDKKIFYPYFNYTPPLLGIIIGDNIKNSSQIEIGAILNISQNPEVVTGMIAGPSIIYRRSLERNLNSIDLNLGFYNKLAFGFGMNYNFNNDEKILGFKPFIGISFFHAQLLYGYNFFSDKKNDELNLEHNTVTVRLCIPVRSLMAFE